MKANTPLIPLNGVKVQIGSKDDLLMHFEAGSARRKQSATEMNERSSRSHSMFIVNVQCKETDSHSSAGGGVVRHGRLYMVDLAGAETVKKTKASKGVLQEAKSINQSLFALGRVITGLTSKKCSHVPYNDSKMTKILQEALGGNSKTVLIMCVSPSTYNAGEHPLSYSAVLVIMHSLTV
jgi:kinesin family protein 5